MNAGKFEVDQYNGDDPLVLAHEIERALQAYGRGANRRPLKIIEFYEGELRVIAKALRAYPTTKVESDGSR